MNSHDRQDPKAEAVIKEVIAVYLKHGMALSHEDTQGAFIVEKMTPELVNWMESAFLGKTLDQPR